MQNRPYADADLVTLQDTVAGWIAAAGRCAYDHVGELPHRIYENLRGRRPVGELVQVFEGGGQVLGISIALRFGCAFDVFAAPAVRGSEAELAMLRHAYAVTDAYADPAEEHVLTDAYDCDGVRGELLRRLGFERFRTWDDVTEVRLGANPAETAPAEVMPAGFRIRSARLADAGGLAEARNAAFGAFWTGDAYREVMTGPGFDPAREIVAEAPDGRIAAFAVYWTDLRNRLGHFEPVGTHPDFQRRGLGRAVLAEGLRRMRAAGMTTVSVNHDADNAPAAGLYRSLGFAPVTRTSGYRRRRDR
ncbi:GNAT family N-acetyltransferase [Hamadaea tsunoensis]|uniref:GNAT family N-acetyltransferase n=1 Tax=Hamadaea tsunoensis TaxID=53368 RepID=UPI0004296180|nr:GNAT family N-acetyltransferase [Hamadaea tsunoensis]